MVVSLTPRPQYHETARKFYGTIWDRKDDTPPSCVHFREVQFQNKKKIKE